MRVWSGCINVISSWIDPVGLMSREGFGFGVICAWVLEGGLVLRGWGPVGSVRCGVLTFRVRMAPALVGSVLC